MADVGNDQSVNLDMSQVRPGAQLAISGMEQVMDVILYGTIEVKQLLATECDLIFECRVCRALFRNLPNLIGHKRMYCQEKTKLPFLELNESESDDCSKKALPDSTSSPTDLKKSSSPTEELSPEASVTSEQTTNPNSKQKSSSKSDVKTRVNETDLNGKLMYSDVVDFVKKTCKLCGIKASERRHLVEHVRNSHSDRLYLLQCPHCPCSFFVTGNLTRHLKNAHQVEAKAADVTNVLPGMNTHALSQHNDKVSGQQHVSTSRRGGRFANISSQESSRKRSGQSGSSAENSVNSSPTEAKKSSAKTTLVRKANAELGLTIQNDGNKFESRIRREIRTRSASATSRKPIETAPPAKLAKVDSTKSNSSQISAKNAPNRVSRRLTAANEHSSEERLDFCCRVYVDSKRCQFTAATMSECVLHCQTEHNVKVDRRDPQPYIESITVNG